MSRKIKWKVVQIQKHDCDLMPDDILYTKRIIPFMRKVTKDEILDDLKASGLLTKEIAKVIERS